MKKPKGPSPSIRDRRHALNESHRRHRPICTRCVLNRRAWATREELRIATVTRIERTYHRRRRQAALGRLTPVEYELIMTTTAIQAGLSATVTVPAADPLWTRGAVRRR